MNRHSATPRNDSFEAYKEWLDAEEKRAKIAVANFYKRNAAPHYSRPVPRWKLALIGLVLGGGSVALVLWWLITGALDRLGQ